MPTPTISTTALVPLELIGVRKSVREGGRDRVVLSDVDLRVAAGEAVAIMGRSGSGKSTLLQIAAGIDRSDAGAVRLCGEDLGTATETRRTALRARHIGFVFQSFHLLPTLTVAENVALPLELTDTLDAASEQRVRGLVARVGLADRMAAFPTALSGGEQQRIALARALAHRPAVLLCDEPTGNLDDDAAAVVLELLHELRREIGCAILTVTHDTSVADQHDRILRLEHGRLLPARMPS